MPTGPPLPSGDDLFTVARLRSLIAVAEQGSIDLAAHGRFTSPAAVSQHVHALEADEVFGSSGRWPRQVTLTEAGLCVREHARAGVRSFQHRAHQAWASALQR